MGTSRTVEGPSPAARVVGAASGSERAILEAFLDYHRDVVVRKIAGLDEAALHARRVGSLTTLGGLVKHLAVVERTWFGGLLGDAAVPELDETSSFELGSNDTGQSLLEDYDQACRNSRLLADGVALTEEVDHPDLGSTSLRWIFVHTIEETARHAGHLDILRELTDGATGT